MAQKASFPYIRQDPISAAVRCHALWCHPCLSSKQLDNRTSTPGLGNEAPIVSFPVQGLGESDIQELTSSSIRTKLSP